MRNCALPSNQVSCRVALGQTRKLLGVPFFVIVDHGQNRVPSFVGQLCLGQISISQIPAIGTCGESSMHRSGARHSTGNRPSWMPAAELYLQIHDFPPRVASCGQTGIIKEFSLLDRAAYKRFPR